jgi:mycobactin lysine-N-oxygenase
LPARIAIVGAGPKAAAIAAKAAALDAAGYDAPAVTIFEPAPLAAAWRGEHGYTDGDQPLCTPAERDLGFPYDALTFGRRVAEEMLASFGWQRFKIDAPRGGRGLTGTSRTHIRIYINGCSA